MIPLRRRGVSLIELMASLLVISVLLIASFNLINASWHSYQNLVWQNKVNKEARQALDDICDWLRAGGNDADMLNLNYPSYATRFPQILPDSSVSRVGVFTPPSVPNTGTDCFRTYVFSDGTTNLEHNQSSDMTIADAFADPQSHPYKTAQFVNTISLSYEYRVPSALGQRVWLLSRTSAPNSTTQYLIRTIYVQVTASYQPEGDGGPVFSRTLQSAVSLRKPYFNGASPSQSYQ